MIGRLLTAAGVLPEESGTVRSLGALHFLVIFSFVLAKAARDGLYLSELPARSLPYVYLGLAVWTGAAITAFGRWTARLPSHLALGRALLLGSAALVLFFVWFRSRPGAPAVVFYLWTGSAGLVMVTQFWNLANERINPRQARRLFGLIGGGGIFGGMVGGIAASQLVRFGPPEGLLLLAAAAQILALYVARGAGQRREETPPALQDREESYVGLRDLARRPYVRALAAVIFTGAITSAVVEYRFKVFLQDAVAGAGGMEAAMNAAETTEITTLLGYFYGAQNLIALLVQIGLTGYLLSRVGARAASYLQPAGVLVGAAAGSVAPGLVPFAGTWLYDTILGHSVVRSVREFRYFPLSRGVRRQARRLIEAVVNRSAEAAAGGVILAVNFALGGSLVQLGVVTVLLAGITLLLERFMNRAYVRELSRSLRWMITKDEEPAITYSEAGLLRELHDLLGSEYERRALYAIDTLRIIDPDGLNDRLPDLLRHRSSRVRARALELSADQCITTDRGRVRSLLNDDDDEVRLHAAFFYCQLAPGDPYAEMAELLRSENERVRSGAFQCVAAHSPPEADEKVAALAKEFLARGARSDRLAVAKGAARRPAPSAIHDALKDLLADPDPEVRRETIRAAGATGLRDFVPALIKLAGGRDEEEALAALARFGDRVVGTLGDYLSDSAAPAAVRRAIPKVLARIGTPEAAAALLRAPGGDRGAFTDETLRALIRIRARNPSMRVPAEEVTARIRAEAERFYRLVGQAAAVRGGAEGRSKKLLGRVLAEKSDDSLRRLFRVLGLAYPLRDTRLAYIGVTSGNARLRAQAIEYLETALSPVHRRDVVPIVEETLQGRRKRSRRGFEEAVKEIAASGDPWMEACGLFAVGDMKLESLAFVTEAGAASEDPAVREMGRWAAARIGRPIDDRKENDRG